MIDTKELVMTGAKASDWIEQQPLSKFTSGITKHCGTGKMCAMGMIADFLGINWSDVRIIPSHIYGPMRDFVAVNEFLRDRGIDFPFGTFDELYRTNPEFAKYFTVQWLRERGM